MAVCFSSRKPIHRSGERHHPAAPCQRFSRPEGDEAGSVRATCRQTVLAMREADSFSDQVDRRINAIQSELPAAAAHFAESGDPCQDRRMAVMDKDVERVGGEVGEVADAQFFQTADQGLATGAGPGGKAVGLVFVASGEGIDANSE